MAAGVNRVTLLGDVAAEPTVHITRAGLVVLTLRVCTIDAYIDDNDTRCERVNHHPVVVEGKRAAAAAKILRRGARVFVQGSLRATPCQGSDGKTSTKTEVIATEVLLAGPGRSALA